LDWHQGEEERREAKLLSNHKKRNETKRNETIEEGRMKRITKRTLSVHLSVFLLMLVLVLVASGEDESSSGGGGSGSGSGSERLEAEFQEIFLSLPKPFQIKDNLQVWTFSLLLLFSCFYFLTP